MRVKTKMIYNYLESIQKWGNHYNLSKAIESGQFFKIDAGLYSDIDTVKDIEIFLKKHNKAVFTMESALYYLGISDYVPNQYVIALDRDSTKYKDGCKQFFMENDILHLGEITINYNGVLIPVFNKERMLIEVVRYKTKLPFDYYKEVISYYRNHISDIDMSLVLDYLKFFPKKKLITRIIQSEVI